MNQAMNQTMKQPAARTSNPTPPTLHQLQQQFSKAMLTTPDDAQQAIDALAPWLDTSHGLSATTHLGIYRNSIHGQFTAALGDLFPVCQRLVGERLFAALCQPYIRQHRSACADVGAYGSGFAEHIAAEVASHDSLAQLPYLADVARLEWAWHQVFHGADEPPFDHPALAAVPADEQGALCFHPPAASHLLSSPYPIHTIWQHNQPDWQPEPGQDEHIDLDAGGVHLLVWRSGAAMRIDPLNTAQHQLLTLLQRGMSLDELAPALAQANPEIDLGSMLPELLQNGWIASFSLPSTQG